MFTSKFTYRQTMNSPLMMKSITYTTTTTTTFIRR